MFRATCCVVLSLIVGGCGGAGDGPELATVEGTVTLDSQLLPDATVLFTPVTGGRPSSAVTDKNGWYELLYTPGNRGAVPGTHRVSITTATTTSDEQGNDIEVPEKLPAKYNANTELQRDVEEGSNEINFDLDSQGEIYREGSEPRRRQESLDC